MQAFFTYSKIHNVSYEIRSAYFFDIKTENNYYMEKQNKHIIKATEDKVNNKMNEGRCCAGTPPWGTLPTQDGTLPWSTWMRMGR